LNSSGAADPRSLLLFVFLVLVAFFLFFLVLEGAELLDAQEAGQGVGKTTCVPLATIGRTWRVMADSTSAKQTRDWAISSPSSSNTATQPAAGMIWMMLSCTLERSVGGRNAESAASAWPVQSEPLSCGRRPPIPGAEAFQQDVLRAAVGAAAGALQAHCVRRPAAAAREAITVGPSWLHRWSTAKRKPHSRGRICESRP
jgi:hypothetical protein